MSARLQVAHGKNVQAVRADEGLLCGGDGGRRFAEHLHAEQIAQKKEVQRDEARGLAPRAAQGGEGRIVFHVVNRVEGEMGRPRGGAGTRRTADCEARGGVCVSPSRLPEGRGAVGPLSLEATGFFLGGGGKPLVFSGARSAIFLPFAVRRSLHRRRVRAVLRLARVQSVASGPLGAVRVFGRGALGPGLARGFRRARKGKAALQLFPLVEARARAAREHGRLSDKAGRGRRIAADPHHAPEGVHFRLAAARPPAARAALSFVGKNGVYRHGKTSFWQNRRQGREKNACRRRRGARRERTPMTAGSAKRKVPGRPFGRDARRRGSHTALWTEADTFDVYCHRQARQGASLP